MILSESQKGTTGLIRKFEIPVSGRDGQGRATHARKKKTRHPLWGCRDVRAREHLSSDRDADFTFTGVNISKQGLPGVQMMKDGVKDEFIGFRVSSADYQRILEKAQLRGEGVNEYCRNLALSESAKSFGMTASERLLFEQVGVIRHLFGRYLKEVLPADVYERMRLEVDQHQAKIADLLLEKRLAICADGGASGA